MSEETREFESVRAARNAYMREYRRKNPEKTREYNTRYWAKKAKNEAADGHRTPDAPGHRSMEEMQTHIITYLPTASRATMEKLERVIFDAERESVIKSISQ